MVVRKRSEEWSSLDSTVVDAITSCAQLVDIVQSSLRLNRTGVNGHRNTPVGNAPHMQIGNFGNAFDGGDVGP
jgi:hypothetical protein